jgi:hypothetical protein
MGRLGGASRLACAVWWACVIAHRGMWPVAQSAGPVLTGEGGVTRGGPRVPAGRVVRMRGRFRKDGAVEVPERVGLDRAGQGPCRRLLRVLWLIDFE